ncbi:hypothetical protein BDZ88DRAFT_26648 [Geranomyces variabilis]|nr:hypothetical protein BDZ88DRAFT_26648 [Geranomyces variabilis]KAJ3132103.1 hypothetical protein HDU90_007536 [Geranomyces variabilis]
MRSLPATLVFVLLFFGSSGQRNNAIVVNMAYAAPISANNADSAYLPVPSQVIIIPPGNGDGPIVGLPDITIGMPVPPVATIPTRTVAASPVILQKPTSAVPQTQPLTTVLSIPRAKSAASALTVSHRLFLAPTLEVTA